MSELLSEWMLLQSSQFSFLPMFFINEWMSELVSE